MLYQTGIIRCQCPRDPVTKIVADNGCRTADKGLDRCCNIGCQIVIGDISERTGAAANPPWLWQNHLIARLRQPTA